MPPLAFMLYRFASNLKLFSPFLIYKIVNKGKRFSSRHYNISLLIEVTRVSSIQLVEHSDVYLISYKRDLIFVFNIPFESIMC